MNRSTPTSHLPSVYAAYRRVETYLDRVATFEPSAGSGPSSLAPMDALLASLFIQFHCRRVAVVDLASEATRGSTTLLCAGLSNVRVVKIRRAIGSSSTDPWGPAFREFLDDDAAAGLAPVEPFAGEFDLPGALLPDDKARSLPESLVLVQTHGVDREGVKIMLDEGLRLAPGAPVLVFGLDRVGRCEAVSEILGSCESSGDRLYLFRELAGVVGPSGLGLIAPRGDQQVELSLQRIEHFFASNFDFLRLVDGVCRAAMAVTQLDEVTQGRLRVANSPSGIDVERLVRLFQETSREKLQFQEELRQARAINYHHEEQRQRLLAWAEQTHDYHHLQNQLASFQASLSHRAMAWVRRLRHVVAPEGSARFVGYRKSRTALRIWRNDGALGVVRHMRHRQRGLKTPAPAAGSHR